MKIQKSKMSWGRFAGLFQTDGNAYFFVDKDGTLRPKFTVSVAPQRVGLIDDIVSFLKTNGFVVNVNKSTDRATNISIERISNCQQFITAFEKGLKSSDVGLVGDKAIAFQIVKTVIDIWTNPNADRIKIVDLKFELSAINSIIVAAGLTQKDHPDFLASKQESQNILCGRLKLPPTVQWKGVASSEMVRVKAVAASETSAMLEQSKLPLVSRSSDFNEFVGGIVDGDGSLQVNLLTFFDQRTLKGTDPEPKMEDLVAKLINKKDGTSSKRRPYEIAPILTLTERYSVEKSPVFTILNNVFQPDKVIKATPVSEGSNAERLIIKSRKALAENAIPFFDKCPPCFDRNVERYLMFREAVMNIDIYHKVKTPQAKEAACKFVELLCSNPDFTSNRTRSLDFYFRLIQWFKSPQWYNS